MSLKLAAVLLVVISSLAFGSAAALAPTGPAAPSAGGEETPALYGP